MRTTINLDERLLGQAKALAARHHRTLTSVLEDALREVLGRAADAPPRRRLKIPASDREPGTLPGVDLDNSAALLDMMAERGDAL